MPALSVARGRWHRLLVEPARPSRIRDRADAHWLVVATVCIGAFMGQFDASVVTVALPALRRSFAASLGGVEWVALAYLLVLVAVVTAVGRFADMVGRKLLYCYGFAVFTLGSGLCALAPTLVTLDVFRAVQAVGAAMLQANSVALIATSVPRQQLGRGIGIQGAAQALGLSLGPTVGGFLLAAGGWRLIFLVNLPVGLVGLGLGLLLLPRTRDLHPRAPFDWLGWLGFAPAVTASLLALSLGRDIGFTRTPVALLLAVAVAATATLIARERRAKSPLLDPALFANRQFSAGVSSGLVSYAVLFGVMFAVPFLLQGQLRTSSWVTGLTLTTLPFTLGLTAPLAGRVADRIGYRTLTVGGMLLCAVAAAALAAAHAHLLVIVVDLAGFGVGLGAFTPPNNAAVMSSVRRDQSGVAGGIVNTTRGLGTAIGVALTALLLGVGRAGARPAGFSRAAVLIAGLSALAAAIASTRDGEPPASRVGHPARQPSRWPSSPTRRPPGR